MLVEIERFVNWQRRRNPDARTWRDYGYDLKQFVVVVGDGPPGSITFQDVDRFVISQAERGYKPTTINRRLAAIISFYTFLSDEDPDLVCPVLSHRHVLPEPQCLPRPVQKDVLAKFFAVISCPFHLTFYSPHYRKSFAPVLSCCHVQLVDSHLHLCNPVPWRRIEREKAF